VMRACPRPLVVVPSAAVIPGQGEVLIAYDGSIQAARALHMFVATGLAALGPVRVVAIHAESKVEAAKIADRAAQYLDSHGIDCTVCPLQTAVSPADVLCKQAAARPTQLLVMGACGRSRLAEFFIGSVTTSLVERCPVPLFLYH
jgi:nucleotide-binding universal stress UspA family protein